MLDSIQLPLNARGTGGELPSAAPLAGQSAGPSLDGMSEIAGWHGAGS